MTSPYQQSVRINVQRNILGTDTQENGAAQMLNIARQLNPETLAANWLELQRILLVGLPLEQRAFAAVSMLNSLPSVVAEEDEGLSRVDVINDLPEVVARDAQIQALTGRVVDLNRVIEDQQEGFEFIATEVMETTAADLLAHIREELPKRAKAVARRQEALVEAMISERTASKADMLVKPETREKVRAAVSKK